MVHVFMITCNNIGTQYVLLSLIVVKNTAVIQNMAFVLLDTTESNFEDITLTGQGEFSSSPFPLSPVGQKYGTRDLHLNIWTADFQ